MRRQTMGGENDRLGRMNRSTMTTRARAAMVVTFLALLSSIHVAADSKDDKRRKLDQQTKEVLDQVLGESEEARELFGKAVGYAVFSNTKAALGVSGGAGRGIAIDKSSGERTYMKMGTAGIGFGIGVKTFHIVMLFENPTVFTNFVEKGWQGDAQAGAAAGTKGAAAKTTFHNGMAVFVRSKKGLMASADISGTKYWKSKLND